MSLIILYVACLQTGPVSSISDLTPSAGWTILDCNSSATAQDIRLVCHDPSKGCDHLYLNGANNTVVKLPDGVRIGHETVYY